MLWSLRADRVVVPRISTTSSGVRIPRPREQPIAAIRQQCTASEV